MARPFRTPISSAGPNSTPTTWCSASTPSGPSRAGRRSSISTCPIFDYLRETVIFQSIEASDDHIRAGRHQPLYRTARCAGQRILGPMNKGDVFVVPVIADYTLRGGLISRIDVVRNGERSFHPAGSRALAALEVDHPQFEPGRRAAGMLDLLVEAFLARAAFIGPVAPGAVLLGDVERLDLRRIPAGSTARASSCRSASGFGSSSGRAQDQSPLRGAVGEAGGTSVVL